LQNFTIIKLDYLRLKIELTMRKSWDLQMTRWL